MSKPVHAGSGKAYVEVIGDPVAQSKSPAIHGFWLNKLGIEATYRATRITPEELRDFLRARRVDPAWRGCNVTMPLKRAAMHECDGLDHRAEAAGATNALIVEDDRTLTGTNTDGIGFMEPLGGLLAQTHLFRMARILGTGGAARAIVRELAQAGFTIVLAGRDPGKARALLDELAPGDHHAVDISHFSVATDFAFDGREGCCDLIVNASPLGMRGQPPLAFDWSHAPPGSVVYDIVTDPVDTPFLRAARAAGFETIDGLAMLIGQAARAFEMFFGQAPPREHDTELRGILMS